MSNFSERNGFEQPRSLVQLDELDNDTRVSLWNVIAVLPEVYMSERRYDEQHRVLRGLWVSYLRLPRDEQLTDQNVWSLIKARILGTPFNKVMDLVEGLLAQLKTYKDEDDADGLHGIVRDAINDCFETNLVGYRIVGHKVLKMDSKVEVEAVEKALGVDSPPSPRQHLQTALDLLADRDHPDYRNSVKESITAVESVARSIAGGKTLGEALPKLSAQGIETHGALLNAWKGFYGYTSDAGGVRHGNDTIAKVDQAFAKYVLVICSAFVTWLTEEARIVGKL